MTGKMMRYFHLFILKSRTSVRLRWRASLPVLAGFECSICILTPPLLTADFPIKQAKSGSSAAETLLLLPGYKAIIRCLLDLQITL